MLLSLTRPGERFQIDESLEGVVLEVNSDQVKLGIRSRAVTAEATPPLVRRSPGGSSGYYYSRGGVTMLVLSRAVGQHVEINDSVDLSIDRVNSQGVQLATTAVSRRRAARPSVVNRLRRWI